MFSQGSRNINLCIWQYICLVSNYKSWREICYINIYIWKHLLHDYYCMVTPLSLLIPLLLVLFSAVFDRALSPQSLLLFSFEVCSTTFFACRQALRECVYRFLLIKPSCIIASHSRTLIVSYYNLEQHSTTVVIIQIWIALFHDNNQLHIVILDRTINHWNRCATLDSDTRLVLGLYMCFIKSRSFTLLKQILY